MNCAEKLLEPTIFLNLYAKTPLNSGSESPWRKKGLEFNYQIIVPSIKFRKGSAKFMISIALFKKFLSYQFISSVEVSNIASCSSKTNESRDTYSIGCRARNITIFKLENDNFKIKVVTLVVHFGRNNIICN